MKPNWTIFKNDRAIGQAITWHKALDILVIQEGLNSFKMEKFRDVLFIQLIGESLDKLTVSYKIQKEA